MSGDYTRFTFAPRKRFAGVLMQQGRVQLDSDWNEGVDLLRERTRLLGLDVGGPAWLPVLTTPNGFLIGALPGLPPDLSIGVGRIYVDGRLAEVFAGEGVTYLNQPFLPEPPPLNPAIDTIVYLDLWEREVTWAEDTRLLDVALGGVDTTTRVQQVWQVKLHEQRGVPAVCGVDLDTLFPPSAGRLTTSAVAPPAPDDPCILPPNAGYRGIENRLYRVEVQVGGPLGTAMFKWSRDNGSIVSRVTAIAVGGGQSRITVNRIGRDQTLRFRINDWVTLTDDHRELNGEAGQMARIVDIDQAAQVVVLDRAVPTTGRAFGPTAADLVARNTRLQRWDEQAPLNPLDADGLMTTGAGPIDLEDGVQVSFSSVPAAGDFHVGDYWVFAARTADASVEILTAAPPRGIRHQYLQLAAIPAGGTPTDCRPKPPVVGGDKEACCTFVVRPGENIQSAIDALPDPGGCVCLKAGLHLTDQPIVIARDNVTLHGESMGAIIFNRRGTTVLLIARAAEHDRVHTLVLRQGEAASGAVIAIEGAEDLVIDDCRLETVGRAESIGIFAVSASGIVLSSLDIDQATIGVWLEKGCRDVSVSGCRMALPKVGPNLPTTIGVLARSMRGFVTVEDNQIMAATNGVIVNDATTGVPSSRGAYSRVLRNRIGLTQPGEGVARTFGIDVAGARTLAGENHISHDGGPVTGIRLCGSGSTAIGNVIVSGARTPGTIVGVQGGFQDGAAVAAVERLVIADNVIEGPQNGIAIAAVAKAEVTGNIIGAGGLATGIGVALSNATDTLVHGNSIARPLIGVFAASGARNALRDNQIDGGLNGIGVGDEEGPAIRGNRVTGVERLGIVVLGVTQRCEMIENRLVRCGAGSATSIGLGAYLVAGEWHVEANEVMDTGLSPNAGTPPSALAYGISGDLILEARIESNIVTYSDIGARDIANEDRALRLRGALEYSIILADQPFILGFAAQIADNKFIGTGATALVELMEQVLAPNVLARFERVIFTGNYCSHASNVFNDAIQAATVSLVGRQCSVANNHVKATGRSFRSYHFHGMPGPFMGNVSHAGVWGRPPADEFPAPQTAFNMIA
ncbi:MAG: DUF6519 domain-containing protein [Inquilinus sp.]|uniref:DUF6519 domain-containing protein n=1 Tax=Inquilinus sp. TaxID=1932117 RepID=UPI003F38F15F